MPEKTPGDRGRMLVDALIVFEVRVLQPPTRPMVATEQVCDVDLDALDVELPRGFGRVRPAHGRPTPGSWENPT